MNLNERLQLHRLFAGLTNLILAIVEILLGLRFIFRLFAANGTAPFVTWLYQTSDILVSPFRGIFQTPVFNGQFVFDITALISLLVYGLIFAFILYLFDIAFGVNRD